MKIFDSIKNKFIKEKHLWDKFYPKDKKIVVPNMSLYEYIYSCNKDRQDNIALNYFNRKITYYELFHDIDLCARAMRSQGIREGDVVSVCMANTPEAVIAFYAISKIGAIANMIHPLSAEEEIKASLISTDSVMLIAINLTYKKINNIIEDTKVYKTVIVSARDSMPTLMGIGYYLLEDHKVKTPKSNEKYIRWKDFIIKGNKYNSKVLVKTTKDQPAVILHSGGTTGTPKNILLSNGNINVVPSQACISLPELDDTDRMLTILPLFHCFGLVECLHFPLVTGGTAILVPKFDASRFDKLLSKYKPTVIPGVPTLFEAMIKNKHMQDIDLSNVKYVVSGGDTLPEEKNLAVNKFLKEHNCRHNIVQGYGLSETSGGCVFATSGTDLLGSSGIPLYGNDLKIISIDTREELGPNNIGDNDDGILFFVQRLKRLIIVSGYNVFPSHIEDIIDKHEAVLSCCVVGIPHPYKVQVPKAYIVLKDEYKVSAKVKRDIKEYCEKNLAKYMIPKEFEFRESLPKTMIGKVDYRTLEKESTR